VSTVENVQLFDHADEQQSSSSRGSTLAAFGDSSLFAVASPSNIETQLTRLLDQVMVQCLRIPTDDNNVELSGSETFFYETLFFHRKLMSEYESTTRQAAKVQLILQEPPSAVVLSASAKQKFTKAVNLLQTCRDEAASGYFADALASLTKAQQLLSDLETDPAFAEPSDFPVEQYLAIFAPLLFPLLVPLFATLVREYKRYRKMTQISF